MRKWSKRIEGKSLHQKPLKGYLIKLLFPKADLNEIFVSFGRTIYTRKKIPTEILIHERKHLEHQRFSYLWAIIWWIKYRLSKSYRYNQELIGYGEQIKFVFNNDLKNIPNAKMHREDYLDKVAKTLSSQMYGNMVEYKKAKEDLDKYENR